MPFDSAIGGLGLSYVSRRRDDTHLLGSKADVPEFIERGARMVAIRKFHEDRIGVGHGPLPLYRVSPWGLRKRAPAIFRANAAKATRPLRCVVDPARVSSPSCVSFATARTV